jgi:hypothetical protein
MWEQLSIEASEPLRSIASKCRSRGNSGLYCSQGNTLLFFDCESHHLTTAELPDLDFRKDATGLIDVIYRGPLPPQLQQHGQVVKLLPVGEQHLGVVMKDSHDRLNVLEIQKWRQVWLSSKQHDAQAFQARCCLRATAFQSVCPGPSIAAFGPGSYVAVEKHGSSLRAVVWEGGSMLGTSELPSNALQQHTGEPLVACKGFPRCYIMVRTEAVVI